MCNFAIDFTGCSAVRLAHLLWEQGVVGSNPAIPTLRQRKNFSLLFLCNEFFGTKNNVRHIVK